MSQFFLANPSLQEDIKFEPLFMEDLATGGDNEKKKMMEKRGIVEDHEEKVW